MRPTAVRFSQAHGSASRRRSSFATIPALKKTASAMTPAEKNAHMAFEPAAVIQAA
jgi:hypothetical protein